MTDHCPTHQEKVREVEHLFEKLERTKNLQLPTKLYEIVTNSDIKQIDRVSSSPCFLCQGDGSCKKEPKQKIKNQ